MDNGGRSRTRFSSSPFSLLINLLSYKVIFLQMQNMHISPYEIYFSSISTFLNLLVLKYQGTEKTPFDTHPNTMAVVIFSLLFLAYCIVLLANARFCSASNVVVIRVHNTFVGLFWSLGLASLGSLLLPESNRLILYLLCLVLSIFEVIVMNLSLSSSQLREKLQSLYQRVWRKFEDWFNVRRRIGRLPV